MPPLLEIPANKFRKQATLSIKVITEKMAFVGMKDKYDPFTNAKAIRYMDTT